MSNYTGGPRNRSQAYVRNIADKSHDNPMTTPIPHRLLEDDKREIKRARISRATAARHNRQLSGTGFRWVLV